MNMLAIAIADFVGFRVEFYSKCMAYGACEA